MKANVSDDGGRSSCKRNVFIIDMSKIKIYDKNWLLLLKQNMKPNSFLYFQRFTFYYLKINANILPHTMIIFFMFYESIN